MEFHVTQNEKQDIRQIPNIKQALSRAVTTEPYNGDNIDISLPDASSELAQIKVELRNKVDRSELDDIRLAESNRQVNEQARQNHFQQAVVDENDRVQSEEERKQNEIARTQGFQSMSNEVNSTLQGTREYVGTLQNTLMNYIDNSVITNDEIDRMIQNALA